MEELKITFGDIEFIASAMCSLFEPRQSILLVSDCHFGKATHFRNNQIPIPQTAAIADYQNLTYLLKFYNPSSCIFLGDLFHSTTNIEWLWLVQLKDLFPKIRFILIEGNHDILPKEKYLNSGFELFPSLLAFNQILLTHEPDSNIVIPNICGHIHPGFTLRGKARQSESMPCFYFANNKLIMPAFGTLTGHVNMDRLMPGGKALCIAGKKLMWVKNE